VWHGRLRESWMRFWIQGRSGHWWRQRVSCAFKDFYILSPHGGDLEQRPDCCNLVGGDQKPFITKMPAGRSLWSLRDDCARRWCWRPHRVGPALRRYHCAGRRLYTAPGACSLPPFLTLSLLRSLARSFSVDDKGAAVQRATKHPGRHLHPHQHPHSRILYASARTKLARTSRSVATRELAPSGAATHPLGIRSV